MTDQCGRERDRGKWKMENGVMKRPWVLKVSENTISWRCAISPIDCDKYYIILKSK